MQRLFFRFSLSFLIIVTIMLGPMQSRADSVIEIKHLMEYIEKSKYTFIRNGQEYSAEKALRHIQNKYEYARRWIKSAEDFIKYTVTKSSMSGQFYKVRCDDQIVLSVEWLTAELKRFREKSD